MILKVLKHSSVEPVEHTPPLFSELTVLLFKTDNSIMSPLFGDVMEQLKFHHVKVGGCA